MSMADAVPGGMGRTSDPSRPSVGQSGAILASGIAAGAAAGAAIGAPFFGIGAVVGGAIGAVVGAIPGIISMQKSLEGGKSTQERMDEFSSALQRASQQGLASASGAIMAARTQVQTYQGIASQPQVQAIQGTAQFAQAAADYDDMVTKADALVADVNTYDQGKASINPWNLRNPALLALQRIQAESDATMQAASVSIQSTSALQAAAVHPSGGTT